MRSTYLSFRSCILAASLALGLALPACATTYSYRFEPGVASGLAGPGPRGGDQAVAAIDDPAFDAEVSIEDGSLSLRVTNKADEVMQVAWSKVTLDRGDATTTSLHPDTDLGWVAPGTTVAARLVPFVLPRSGDPAARYEERVLALKVPVTVRREPRVLQFTLTAHVAPV
jgi:hypothetical protein